MRLLDRLFGALPFPWDLAVPAALWVGLCAGLLVFAAAPGARRLGAWLALGNAALWGLLFAAFALLAAPPEAPRVLLALEAPLGALWRAMDEALWWVFGLNGPGRPRDYFTDTFDWPDGWLPVAAGLASQCALLSLLALAPRKKQGQTTFS